MEVKTVELYPYFGQEPPAHASGRLHAWLWHTSPKVSAGRRRPAVLILPGGGYEHVSQREAEPVALRFAAHGYAAFVLEYSCLPLRFPTALREAAMAMRCLRENASAWEVDPHQIAAVGFSAGGHLCGTLGTMFDAPEVADLGPAELLRPDALVLCYPVAASWGRTNQETFTNLTGGDAALQARLSVDRLVRPDMPPVFLWHTRTDPDVPCRNSLVLAQALEEAGIPFAMHIYRQGPHGVATADAEAYPADAVPDASPDLPDWPAQARSFLAECGFAVREQRPSASKGDGV